MTQSTSAATAGATRDVTTRQSHEFWGKAEGPPAACNAVSGPLSRPVESTVPCRFARRSRRGWRATGCPVPPRRGDGGDDGAPGRLVDATQRAGPAADLRRHSHLQRTSSGLISCHTPDRPLPRRCRTSRARDRSSAPRHLRSAVAVAHRVHLRFRLRITDKEATCPVRSPRDHDGVITNRERPRNPEPGAPRSVDPEGWSWLGIAPPRSRHAYRTPAAPAPRGTRHSGQRTRGRPSRRSSDED